MSLANKKRLLIASAMVTSMAFFASAPTRAQDGATSASDRDTIVVTARKREENLQDVPISITAITEAMLQDNNVYGLEDIAELTPGLQFRLIGGVPEVTVRGLAQTDQLGLQANVGVFIDGIFLNNRSSIELTNMDIGQVEVLKGPQSSLFGRNTFAGAINYRTKSPTLGAFDAYIEGQVGNHDRYGVKGSVNIPLNDFGAVRFFGGYSEFDGAVENLRGGENVGGWDKRLTWGASALFEVDRFRLKGFFVQNEIEDDNPATFNTNFRDNNAGSRYDVPDGMGGTTTVWTINAGPFPELESVSLDPLGRGNQGDFWLAYGSLDIDLDFATLTGIISHSESEYNSFFDNVGDPDAVNRPFFGIYTDQFFTDQTGDLGEQDSYEVRLTSNEGSPFDWLIGYSHYDSTTGSVLGTTTPLFADPSTLSRITNVEERLIVNIDAIYGSFNFPVSPQLNIFGEVRYTDEDQTVTDLAEIFFFPLLSRPLTSENASFSYWGGKGGLDYALADDVLIYAYAARGIKSGGINFGNPAFPSFEPETNWTYEAGVKAGLFDGRGLVNAAVYYIDWTDLQSVAPASLAAGPATVNGIGATSFGVELDASFDVTENLNLRVATTYIDASYDDGFIDGAIESRCGVNASPFMPVSVCDPNVGGNQIANTSDFTFFGSALYEVPELIFGKDGFARVSFSHEAGRPLTSLNLAETNAINLVNFRFGIRDDNTELAFWMDNAFDESYLARNTPRGDTSANATCFNCGISSNALIVGNGRTFGVTLRQEF